MTNKDDSTCKVVVKEMGPDEVGKSNCDVPSSSNQEKVYDKAQEYTMIKLVCPAHVELLGLVDMVLYEGEKTEFICQTSGGPVPTVLKFYIEHEPLEGARVEDESVDVYKRVIGSAPRCTRSGAAKS